MAITDEEIFEHSQNIIEFLSEKTDAIHFEEAIQVIYNHAVDDAASFVADIILHQHKDHAIVLGLVAQDIRRLLTLRLE